MKNYIDGFVFPLPKQHIATYRTVASKIAEIWKEHGALSYAEYIQDSTNMDGILSFSDVIKTADDETLVFGWVSFESKESCEIAHLKVAADSRMADLIAPIIEPSNIIFDVSKMIYGRFEKIV